MHNPAKATDFADLGDEAIARAVSDARPVPGDRLVNATPYIWCDPDKIPPRQWIYGRSIQRGHVRAIVAQGGAGKTVLSIGEALAMVTGRDLLGQVVHGGPRRVWIWNLEDDRDELARIIQAGCKHWGISQADLQGRLFVDSALDGAILKLATSGNDGLTIHRPIVEALTEEIRARKIDYLHIDPFVSSHSANENDNGEIDAIAKEWASVAKRSDCAVGLAHHVSKAGAGEATALAARGASALVNACRSVLTLNRMTPEEARDFGIEDERRRRFFRVYDDKNNRAPPSDKSEWFQLWSVDLCNGGIGAGDSLAVVVPWSPPDAFDGITRDHLYRVQIAVDEGDWRESSQSAQWVGKAVAQVLGLSAEKHAAKDRNRINALLRTWYREGALEVFQAKDEKRNARQFVKVGTWAVDGVAPPRKGEAGQGVAGEALNVPRPTCPPVRGRGGAGYAADNSQVGQNGRAPLFPADNPVLGKRHQILAPGEATDDEIPGWGNQ